MTDQERLLSDNMHSALGVKPVDDTKRFKLGNDLTAQFKDGSLWIRQDQRYGEIEITPQVSSNLEYLAEKHGWRCS